jgi:hypothetical protein
MAILTKESRLLKPVGHWRCDSPKRRPNARSRRIRRACRQYAALVLAALLSFACAPLDRAQTEAPGEYQLKAAFLFNFAKFIDWPPASFSSPQSPFVVCILGPDPFGHAMDEAFRDKMIDNRPVAIQRFKDIAQARQCHMVFVSQSESFRLADIIQALHGQCVLLVGESEGFAAAGGVIEFAIEQNHVHFVINTDAAGRAGLRVSSKLLSLARVVHDSAKSDRS